jgi:hypothetical protein
MHHAGVVHLASALALGNFLPQSRQPNNGTLALNQSLLSVFAGATASAARCRQNSREAGANRSLFRSYLLRRFYLAAKRDIITKNSLAARVRISSSSILLCVSGEDVVWHSGSVTTLLSPLVATSTPGGSPLTTAGASLLTPLYASGTSCQHEHWHGHRSHAEQGEGLWSRDCFCHCFFSLGTVRFLNELPR